MDIFNRQPTEKVSMLDIFPDFETEEVSRTKVGKRFLALLVFLLVSALAGGIASIGPLTALSVGTQAAEPAVTIWKSIDDQLPNVVIASRNTVYDKNGTAFAQIWTEDRISLTNLNQISKYAKEGLIDTEDKNFYQNKGFDLKGTLRAAVTGHGGGSGITQQLIKNLQFYNLLGKSQQKEAVATTYTRKLKELKIAMQYEKTHSKDEILLEYFNTVAFGGPDIYGIETASKYFFGKKSADLTLAQAAALVGSAQNPSIFNFSSKNDYTNIKIRQAEVLGRMVAQKDITAAQAAQAKKEPLKFVANSDGGGNCYSSKYPMYCHYVYQYLLSDEKLGSTVAEREAVLAKGGLQIHTYMDPKVMNTIEAKLKAAYGDTNRIVAPTAVIDPKTGGVVGMGQNREWGSGKGKTTYVLPNQPSGEGSVYKIFTLAAALNKGYTEKDLNFASYGCPLQPGSNYDSPSGGFHNEVSCALQGGKLNYKQALAYSSNTWFVTLEMKIGVDAVKQFSKSVGLNAPSDIDNRSLSYTLGSVDNSPIQIAAAAATFANKGVYCPATPISSITYADGTEPATPDNYNPAEYACRAVMSPQAAGIVLKGMRANVSGEIPNAFGLRANIKGYDTVGKSGTNENLNSTWEDISARYSLFTNVYDMDQTSRGITNVLYYGSYNHYVNTATLTASDLMRSLLSGTKNIALDYNDSDNTITQTPVDQTDFTTVPNVLGMTPAIAESVLQNAGFVVKVSKSLKNTPTGYNSGTVVVQSIDPGQRIAKGKTREITLYVGR